jgi:ATP synthase protein I
MPAIYAQIVRRSALVTAAAAVVMAAVAGGVAGGKGLLGAALGVALVAVFFAISVVAISRAARVSPQAMMITALVTYVVKIVLLLIFVAKLGSTTAFNPRLFGLTALVCILAWSLSQVFWSMKLKFLYVEPHGQG